MSPTGGVFAAALFSSGFPAGWVAGGVAAVFVSVWAAAGFAEAAASPLTADVPSRPERIHRLSEVTMNRIAAIVVTLERMFAVLRGPNAVCVPPPPKAPARSAALPDWSRTATISTRQTNK